MVDDPTTQTPLPADSEALDRLLSSRYSCRAFLPRPVPPDVIERILKMSQKTASWCNSQPWQIVITSGAATERLRQAMLTDLETTPAAPDIEFPREYLGVYLDRRRECGFQLYDSVGIRRGDRPASAAQARRNFALFDAPHAAIVTTDEALGSYGAIDCGAYVSNFMLSAASLGVASIAQAAVATRSPLLRRHFGIPDDRRIVCGISFGYADQRHPVNGFRTRRADTRAVVTMLDR